VLDASVVEQVVGVVVADNLDLGCVVIERAATDKVCFCPERNRLWRKDCVVIRLAIPVPFEQKQVKSGIWVRLLLVQTFRGILTE